MPVCLCDHGVHDDQVVASQSGLVAADQPGHKGCVYRDHSH